MPRSPYASNTLPATMPPIRLLALVAALSSLTPLFSAQSTDPVLWYREPAHEAITEALPIGNGRLGALVTGGVSTECLELNESTLWAGGPYNAANPKGPAALPEIRRLVFTGHYKEAQDLCARTMMGNPLGELPYQPLGDIRAEFLGQGPVSGYRRELDLDRALARVSYDANGVHYTREYFVSYPDQAIVMRFTASKPGAISCILSFDSPERDVGTDVWTGGIRMHGRNLDASGVKGALTFVAEARVSATGGRVTPGERILTIRHADSVTIVLDAATSYRSWNDVSGDPYEIVQDRLAKSADRSFADLLARHEADFRPKFERLRLDLGALRNPGLSADEQLDANARNPDPAVAALYFDFARYLLLSCSRPGGQPATLQGLWNDQIYPPWGSKYTVNINTEMNYWPADPGNLGDCVQPLLHLVEDLAQSGARTAKIEYGAGGWVCHHNTDLWRGTAPVDGPFWGMWPTGGAWLCLQLWEHYQYTGDRAFLERLYPLMKGSAQFFLDTLVRDPSGRYLVVCPSVSPEHAHAPDVSIAAGTTMDNTILRDLFADCAEAAQTLGVDSEFRTEVLQARAKLPPFRIGKGGYLQEWMQDWDAQAPDIHHRHVSHLFGLFPSQQITLGTTPALAKAAIKTLEMRGDLSTGWSLAWKINLWARLRQGNHAWKLLQDLLNPSRTYSNFFDAHPPFQIDGNFGGASGIMEMLVQSRLLGPVRSGQPTPVEVDLLPALPDAWPTGSVKGICARGGLVLDLEWSGHRLHKAVIRATIPATLDLRYAGKSVTRTLAAGQSLSIDADQL